MLLGPIDVPLRLTWIRNPALLGWVGGALVALGFVVAYGLEPLYASNQNERFLFGFARSGLGNLDADWQANTFDPLPLFSSVVELTYRFGDPKLFYAFQVIIIVVYFAALVGIATTYRPLRGTYMLPLFVSLLFIVHSSAVERLSEDRLGFDLFGFMRGGVANQEVVGHYFQPNVFGVLLVASIWAYLRHRTVLAAILVAVAPAIHPTYLLPAFALMLVYLFELIRQDHHIRRALGVAVAAALIVLPSFVYPLTHVIAAPPDIRAEANRIMVEVRVPHHAVPANWFGWDDLARIALVAAALIAVLRTRLFVLL